MSRLFVYGAVLTGLAALAACSSADTATAKSTGDWAQFRGPNRDDISPDKGLLKSWPKDGPRVVWKGTGVGTGYSSVAVAGDKVFTMGDKDGSSWIFAVSRDKGDIVWSAKVGRPGGNYEGTRCTPTVDGDLVYGIGQFGDLVCVDRDSGKEKWRKNFGKDFGGQSGGWNFTESPLVDGDRLVFTPGGSKATMVVLDKRTGDEIWRSPLKQTAGYSSIVISNACNVKQYVQVTASGTIGVSAKDGKLLWHYPKFSGNTANIPTPIVLGDQIFTTVGYGRGAALLTLIPDGDGVKHKEEYHTKALTNKHGGVLIVGDYVYGDAGDGGNLTCLEWKTGKVQWNRQKAKSRRSSGGGSASVTYADGMLYVHYANGWASLVAARPDRYEEVSAFQIPDGHGQRWAHPVVIGGRLYIREFENLWCYDVKAK
jgi:outer membrane protein assembly factor BamB